MEASVHQICSFKTQGPSNNDAFDLSDKFDTIDRVDEFDTIDRVDEFECSEGSGYFSISDCFKRPVMHSLLKVLSCFDGGI